MDLNVFYYSEGEILTRFLYTSSPFKLDNFSIKDPSIISKPLYLNYNGNYFTISDLNSEITYAEYIKPNKFFSSKYISGKIVFKQDNIEDVFDGESKYYFRIPTNKEVIASILNTLSILIEDQSAHSIRISHSHSNPYFSKDICNNVVKNYMLYDVNKKKLSTDKIVKFINIQKDSVRKRLINSEKKLRSFKKNNKLNNVGINISNVRNKVQEADSKWSALKKIIKI